MKYLITIVLILFLAVTCCAQEFHLRFPDRYKVMEQRAPGTTRHLVDIAHQSGCAGVIMDQWSKNGDPLDDRVLLDSIYAICDYCSTLGLEVRFDGYNPSKHHYGYPESVKILPYAGLSQTIFDVYRLNNNRDFCYFSLPPEFAYRYFTITGIVLGAPLTVQIHRDTLDNPWISKYTVQPGAWFSLPFSPLENSTDWLLYMAGTGRIFVEGIKEQQVPADWLWGGEYIGKVGESGFAASRTMNPDCTAAFYRVAMQQMLRIRIAFGNRIEGCWFDSDEVFLMDSSATQSAGERYRDMIIRASWYHYSLFGTEAWGWSDCLGGHNSVPYSRATVGMTNSAIPPEVPWLDFPWTEGKPGAIETELSRFPNGTGFAFYLGVNDPIEAKAAMDAHDVPVCVVFTWDYPALETLPNVIPQLK